MDKIGCENQVEYYRNSVSGNGLNKRIYVCKEHSDKSKGDTLIANAPIRLKCSVNE